jgi:SPFH domain / Band 7 family
MKAIKLPLIPVFLFNQAGPNDYVFKGGELAKQGLGLSTWVLPRTTVAVVPTTQLKKAFEYQLVSQDGQGFTVTGEIVFEIDPKIASKKLDFTVDPLSGQPKTDAIVEAGESTANILRPHFLKFAAARDIKALNNARHELEDQIQQVVGGLPASATGIKIIQVAVARSEPADARIAAALRASVAEQLLGEADAALAERQKKAEEYRREQLIQKAETDLQVEKERVKAIEARLENEQKEAKARAENATLELAPFKDMSPALVLANALRTNPNIRTINIVPELLMATTTTQTVAQKPAVETV